MRSHDSSLYWQLGTAFLLAPVCCIFSVYVFHLPLEHPLWLFSDPYAFLMLVLFYPMVEELSFRGVIQGALALKFSNRLYGGFLSAANLVTSLLFVAIHFVHHPPLWAMAVFVPSLIFGYFRDRFGGVVPSIVLHAFYNGVFYSTMGHA